MDAKYMQLLFKEDSSEIGSSGLTRGSTDIPELTEAKFNELRKEYFRLFGTLYDALKPLFADITLVSIEDKLFGVLEDIKRFGGTSTTGDSICIHCHVFSESA